MGELVSLKKALENQANTMTSSLVESARYICPSCGKVVEPVTLQVFGRTRYLRAVCSCALEKEAKEESRRREVERQQKIQRAFDIAELGPRFGECTFDSWEERKGAQRSFDTAKDYAENFGQHLRDGQGLLIFGQPGNGKTHLAAAIANAILPENTCVFRGVPALLKRLLKTIKPGSKVDESDLMDVLRDADLLVLDDIGAEKCTGWTEMTLYYIVDERYRWRKPLVVTTNCDLEVLEEHVGERTMDRLLEMCVLVENKGSSFRRERAMERVAKMKAGKGGSS